jgi:glutamate synthase (NADPH/NADH) small chain
MGFLHPEQNGLLDLLNIEKDERGNVKTSEKNYQTNLQKVFAAGDVRRGQSLVVWAISEGRECARKVDEFLNNVSVLESRDASLQFFTA